MFTAKNTIKSISKFMLLYYDSSVRTSSLFITIQTQLNPITQCLCSYISLSARILHRAPPPRLQVDQNFLIQKIVADPKMRCHQKSFGIWRVTEAILGQKTCFFPKNIFWKKFIINHTIFLIFRYAFYRY